MTEKDGQTENKDVEERKNKTERDTKERYHWVGKTTRKKSQEQQITGEKNADLEA